MAITNQISYRLLSKKRLTDVYRYAGVVAYVGDRLGGQYIDNKTSAFNNVTCQNPFGSSCDCCGQGGPPYYSCNECSYYSVYVDNTLAYPSSSFTNSPYSGYYDSTTKYGFKKFAITGDTTAGGHLTNYDTCATNCAGYTETNLRNNAPNDFFGNNAMAGIKAWDGTLWTWGYNGNGELGNNSTISRYSPVQVGTESWKSIVGGSQGHFAAIRSDDTLWVWGSNNLGQLGDGTTTTRSVPVQIVGSWKFIAAGATCTFGIKSDDTLWGWGYNGHGLLGDFSTTNRSSPVQVAGGGSWKFVISDGQWGTSAIKTDGTAYGWGYNGAGQIGDGTNGQKTSPTLTGGGFSDWTHISIPGYTWRAGVRSNGTLWVWGDNPFGVSNLGGRLSPIQVGSATDHVSGPTTPNYGGIRLTTTRNMPIILTNGNLITYNGYNSTRTDLYTSGYVTDYITHYNINGGNGNGNWIIKNIP